MNKIKRLIIWSLIPIILELIGLLYFNNFYLNDETTFNTKKVDLASKKSPNKINAKIPENAENISVSYNGNYISYCEDGVLNVIDTSNNKSKEIKIDDGKLSYYKWLPDKDIILIGEKYINYSGDSYLKFESYNAKKDEKSFLSDEKNKEMKISLSDEKYEVLDIAVSTATNVTYIKVGKEGAKSRLYRINVMAQVEETKYLECKLGKIAAQNKEDRIIYEDMTYNRIRAVGMKNPIATGENATHYLLNTDSEDRIYIGNGTNGKIKKIFIINLKSSKENVKTITLPQMVDKSNIYIGRDGKVLVDDISKSIVTEMTSGKETKYTGKLIGVYSYGVISADGKKIIGSLF
ncbi:hypothetical protein JMF89_00260 [Clostridiaceae bacterium UIB06]|uniref:Dipeptidyl-peptidase IV n=1 Tax=Clostridium thailandense TaxID=2794346 RepID=A0A949X3V6_9CLOT|nr:hypothetical protein [Clostridium thailandense]MBV7272988.1 hypothetical protein [Clostridium thailandense]MCH5135652.1 hypothetical protein [Clostridiaceae bacterium UIB06]